MSNFENGEIISARSKRAPFVMEGPLEEAGVAGGAGPTWGYVPFGAFSPRS